MINTELFKKFENKTVLVTGNTGFKGSWLSIWLKELGANVIGYSLDVHTDPSNFKASGLKDKITHIKGDIRDLNRLNEVFDKYQPEIVMHLAAQAIVRISYQSPKETFDSNVGGTVNVLEAVRTHPNVRVLVNVTSDKCYENKEWIWGYRENDPMGGHDPYSASKGCAELVFSAYHKSFFNNGKREIGVASVRAGNVVGGGDWADDRLIPDSVRALSNGIAIPIRSPYSIRPWQHVLEPLGAYLMLGALLLDNHEKYSGAWNFGPNESEMYRVKDVIELFLKFWSDGTWQDLSTGTLDNLHEAAMLRLCCDKARILLKWKSVLSIEECLNMTAGWYKKYYSGEKELYQECVEQIRQYTSKARDNGLAWAQ